MARPAQAGSADACTHLLLALQCLSRRPSRLPACVFSRSVVDLKLPLRARVLCVRVHAFMCLCGRAREGRKDVQGVAILQHVALLRTRAVAVVPRPANSQCPRVFSRRSYIATQGPTETTVNDFWQMVCEKGSNVIVMLTALHDAGKEQCTQYFPAPSATAQYGDIKVTTAKEDKPNSSIVVRTFSLEVVAKPTRMNEDMAGKRFEIKHYQYLDFSPIKTPENPAGLLEFISM